MLTIRRTAPGTFTAASGETLLGQCRFRAAGDVTVIEAILLADETDMDLLDGLARAALFAGLDEGRAYGELGSAVREQYGAWLLAAGWPKGKLAVEALPRRCGGVPAKKEG